MEIQSLTEKREALTDSLTRFATLDKDAREAELAGTLNLVHDLTSKETTPHSKEFMGDLRSAINAAKKTEYALRNGTVVNPWEKNAYTVVAIDMEGNILGSASMTKDEVYEVYGENLIPYALSKAVIRLHLELAGMKGGLDNDENYDYMEKLLDGKHLIFKGESVTEDIAGQNDHPGVIIGASGCALNKKYRNTLLPDLMGVTEKEDGTIEKNPMSDVNPLAGAADEEFAEAVAIHLARPGMPLPYVREVSDFARLRRNH